jgi:hypothetical protein
LYASFLGRFFWFSAGRAGGIEILKYAFKLGYIIFKSSLIFTTGKAFRPHEYTA